MAQKPTHEQFSGPEMDGIKAYGAALGGNPTEFEKAVEEHLEGYEAYKMKQAQTGGSLGLGPSDIEKEQAQQQSAQAKTQATQQAQTASQAQAAQSPVNAPPAPSGPVGVSTPFSAQKGPQPAPGAQDVEPEVPGVQSPASQIQPPQPDQEEGQ